MCDPLDLVARLDRAEAYLETIADPITRAECAHLIYTWRNGAGWPSHAVMTPCMRVTARILRGESID